ncbi:MAG: T9SS type A sorting domain-containing protein [Bacteroidia bacterium]|nr:T9SS type A sorting domain-containing protein [Bacteroidia bacterium]
MNNPICTQIYNQQNAKIIEDGNGGAIIVWEDYRNDPTQNNADIYAQRIDKNGNIKWTSDGKVICNSAGHQSNPNIDYANGKVIIIWNDSRNGNTDIYAQMIDTSGNILWTNNGVAVVTKAFSQNDGKVAITNTGEVYVVYQDSSSGNWDIYAQKLNSSGIQQWGSNGAIVCNAGYDQKNPRLELASSGGIYVVWQDKRNGANYDIYCQKLDNSGNRLWNPSGNGNWVCSTAGTQSNPKIEPFGTGFITVWQDNRTGGGYDVYAQYVDNNGVSQWTTNGKAICISIDNQSAIDVKSTGNSAFIVWKDFRNTLHYDIYMQKIGISGNVAWTNNGIIISNAMYDQINPNLATDNTNAYVVWQDSSAGDWNIYAAKVDPNGNVLWNTVVCNASNNQTDAKNIYDYNGGTIVVWKDKRNELTTNWDIYAQRIFSNGSLTNIHSYDSQFVQAKIFPNPTQNEIFVQFFHSSDAHTITVTNITGEKLLTHFATYALEKIDVSYLPAGIYFIDITNSNGNTFITRFIKK